MTLNYSIIAGLISGCLCTSIIFYLTAYRRLKRRSNEKEAQLMQLKAECEELSSTVFHLETQHQVDQQNAANEKEKLLSELQQALVDKADLKDQYAKTDSSWHKEWETKSKEIEQLQIQVAQLTKEKSLLESKIAQSDFEHKQQRENLVSENNRFQSRVERLARERTELGAKLEELSAVLEQERLGFDLQLAQSQSSDKKLESTLNQPEEANREQENSSLRVQIQQLKSEKIELEQKIRNQNSKNQALETEIKQLMERLLQIRQIYHSQGG